MKTGFQSVKLAVAGFLVPFIFVFSPELLLIGITPLGGLRVVLGASVGVLLIGVAVEGYFLERVILPLRLIAAAGALCLIDPGVTTDLAGLCALALVLAAQVVARKKAGRARIRV